jgi:hypothetical protein
MLPADMLLGYIITSALGDRPIYFATTTQAFDELRLGNFIIRQGVAFKLNDGPVQPDSANARGIVPMPDDPNLRAVAGPFVDLPRTAELLDHVFVHHKGFPDDFKAWVDAATQQIPLYYAYTYLTLGQAYGMIGDSLRMNQQMAQSNRFLRLANQRRAQDSN